MFLFAKIWWNLPRPRVSMTCSPSLTLTLSLRPFPFPFPVSIDYRHEYFFNLEIQCIPENISVYKKVILHIIYFLGHPDTDCYWQNNRTIKFYFSRLIIDIDCPMPILTLIVGWKCPHFLWWLFFLNTTIRGLWYWHQFGGALLKPLPIKTHLEAILARFFYITLIGGQK